MKILPQARSVLLLIGISRVVLGGTVWHEISDGGGDAPRFPATAQVTIGFGPLTDIIGRLVNGDAGADMYEIQIVDFANFSALTSPVGLNGVLDPALFLFDLGGHGIYGSDNISMMNTQAFLPPGDPHGPTSNGLYFLLIVPSGNEPLNKFGNSIFPCGCTTGSFGPQTKNTIIEHYSNTGIGPDGSGRYDISLTGAAFITPEPATFSLMAIAGLGGALAWRRRSRQASPLDR